MCADAQESSRGVANTSTRDKEGALRVSFDDRRDGGGTPVALLVTRASSGEIARLVSGLGWRMAPVSPEDAHEMAGFIRPDVVVVDIDADVTMRLAHELVQHPRLEWVPVVAVGVRERDVTDWFEAGATEVVRRGIHRSEVAARLQRVMRTRTELVELVRQNRHLDELASVDVLTDLPNRRRLDEQLRHLESFATRRSEPLGVLIVDVDHFKAVNDTRGHHAGDEVLREVAARLRRGLRNEDSIGRSSTATLGRWAGDEFILGFAGATEGGLGAIAERLRALIADEPIALADGDRLPITISIGGSSARSEPWPQLLRRADTALYAVKESGRNASRVIAADHDVLTLPQADRRTGV